MKRLEFHISYACSNSCIFCSESENLKKGIFNFIAADSVMERLAEFSAKGFNHITFTGGEPTLHPGFLSLLDFSKEANYRTYVTTNGGLFYRKAFCRRASRGLDELCFSVHGHNPDLHNLHTHNNDSFRLLRGAIENIESLPNNILGFANIVLTRHNFESLGKIISFLAQYKKIRQVLISSVAPEGRGLDNFKDLIVPLARIKGTIPQLAGIALRNNIVLRLFGLPLCVLTGYEELSNDLHWSGRVTLERYIEGKTLCLKKTLSYKPIRGRIKPLKCGYCKKRDVCGGLFRRYYKEFGADELEPFF